MATTVDMINLKLIIDVNNQKVLFAEAGKDFVELLSSTLQYFPFSSDFSVGSLGKLSKSLENLDDRYTKPPSQVPDITCAFACREFDHPYVADIPDVLCPSCGDPMTYTLYFFSYYTSGVGYKQEDIIFMIMDNLEVNPMLTISNIIAELNQLNGGVEEKTVHLGTSQVWLLAMCMHVLTLFGALSICLVFLVFEYLLINFYFLGIGLAESFFGINYSSDGYIS